MAKRTTGNLWAAVQGTDRNLAQERVERLRKRFPEASRDKLHAQLTRYKCLQVGGVAALATLTGNLPGIGRIAQSALGPFADPALLSTLQAELVVETFVLYDVEMPDPLLRVAVLTIAASNLGADEIARRSARTLVDTIADKLGTRLLKRAWPIAEVGTSTASHIAATYAIGQRAQALCLMRETKVSQWPGLFMGLTAIDPKDLTDWASKSARTAVEQVSDTAKAWSTRLAALVPSFELSPASSLFTDDEAPKRKPVRKAAARKKPAAKKAPAKKSAAKKAPAKKAARKRVVAKKAE
ncbi:MAG: hypothetical protein IPK97_11920 [Ahniella sp.]|nr:hypothetical protein [Ahniella sp.]